MDFINDNINIIRMIITFIISLSGFIGALAVIWKFFGSKITAWIKSVAATDLTVAKTETEEKFITEIEKLNESFDEIKTGNKRNAKALMRLTRDRITQAHTHTCKQGEISKHELKSLLDLYESYQELGGNGYVHELVDDIKNLDIRKGEYYD